MGAFGFSLGVVWCSVAQLGAFGAGCVQFVQFVSVGSVWHNLSFELVQFDAVRVQLWWCALQLG